MSLNLFARLCKVDEAKRLVFGRLADDSIDHSGEAMDYEKSKPYFETWSQTIAKESGGKSVGNLRAMHGKVAAGKFTEIEFDDAARAINVVAKVVDDNEWAKVLEGVYTGFSIGGSYVGQPSVEKVDGVDVRRYVADPTEGSLVDRPCNKNALFFDVQKADGSLAKVNFQKVEGEPAPAPAEDDLVVNGTAEEVAKLAKLMNDSGLTMADVLAKIAAPAPEPKVEPKVEPEPTPEEIAKAAEATLRKGMYSCSSFAQVIASLQSLQSDAAYSAYFNGGSSMAKQIGACIAMCGTVLKAMIDEELKGLGDDAPALALALACDGLMKSFGEDDPIVPLLKVGARNSKADTQRIQAVHDHSAALGAECTASKAEAEGELQKSIASAVEPLQKLLTEATEDLAKVRAELEVIKAQPATPKIALRAVTKGTDTGENTPPPAAAAPTPVVDSRGEQHEAAGLIKNLHRTGGAPLHAR